MPTTPYVYEFGMGLDVHGSDSTTAARRAVFDAIRHSSLPLLRQIRDQGGEMLVDVLIGVPRPASVDLEAVKAELPHGTVSVKAVEGGLQAPGEDMPLFAVAHITVSAKFEDKT
jgi:uncharacterized protein (TIGR02058 family)